MSIAKTSLQNLLGNSNLGWVSVNTDTLSLYLKEIERLEEQNEDCRSEVIRLLGVETTNNYKLVQKDTEIRRLINIISHFEEAIKLITKDPIPGSDKNGSKAQQDAMDTSVSVYPTGLQLGAPTADGGVITFLPPYKDSKIMLLTEADVVRICREEINKAQVEQLGNNPDHKDWWNFGMFRIRAGEEK